MESDQGKLFVGGISRETTEATLKDHFSKYGNVVNSVVAKDRNTKIPRGFGFVLFSEPFSADKALQDTHVILGRTVEVKKAIPRSEQHQNQQQQHPNQYPNQQQINGFSRFSRNGSDAADNNTQFRTKKIFVGGLSASLTEEEFKNYFERFGRITDVVVMHDSSTNRPRGFGFVTFESEESVENVMQKSFHELNNRLVEVKRAVPKEGSNGGNSNYNMKTGFLKRSAYNGFQPAEYSSNNLGHGIFPGYAPPFGYNNIGGYVSGTGVYGSGYPTIAYGRIGYGVTPVAPRAPLYAPVMLGARVYPLPYGSASIYPAYGGVGLVDTLACEFNGIIGVGDGKSNLVLGGFGNLPANAMPSQNAGVSFESGRPCSNRGGASNDEEDQNSERS